GRVEEMPRSLRHAIALSVALAATMIASTAGLSAQASSPAATISTLSAASCSGSNAEVEQAVDVRLGYVYEEWMGCSKIAFSRSPDARRTFTPGFTLPPLGGCNLN